jgi:5'-3' exonuclease
VDVYLVDGTYELFRHHYGRGGDRPFGATVGVLATLLQLVAEGADYVAVATDHVIESFRNELWSGYKTSAGVPPQLLGQFPVVEKAMEAAGFAVWPQVTYEADDALAAGAAMAAADPRVDKVVICTPDKDLGQSVGGKVVQLDRRKGLELDARGVERRMGVPPGSVPDYLALVGDAADGYPGLPGWGAKSAAAVLQRWGHLESIPTDPVAWQVVVRASDQLSATLRNQWDLALLFRRLATVDLAAPVSATVEELRWAGSPDGAAFAELCDGWGAPRLAVRVAELAARRGRGGDKGPSTGDE